MVRDIGLGYRDGGEQAVLELVSAAQDLASDSVEMVAAARGWAQRYHVDPARASILRCLDLPADARVLEIGAGCGAITRYLGEHCALVDSLEPVPARAAANAARCRDLDGVEVIVGELDDVPAEPTYDVVVVIGVLEYVGGGSDDREPYLEFLRGIRRRLVDGGTLVLAIENKLGVKYLVGAPEDHTNVVFDGPEGYPRGGKARTFDRGALGKLIGEAGFTTTSIRVAFPDYKIPRAVFGSFPDDAASLAWRVPRFPSPDWRSKRPKLADERLLWRSLVEAGLGHDFGNSFLVLAGATGRSMLWPERQLGMFWSTDRVAELNAQTRIVEDEFNRVVFERTALRGSASASAESGVRLIESTTVFEEGVDLTEVVADGGMAAFRPLVAGWLTLLDEALRGPEPDAAIDVVPHNLVVDPAGELRVIDTELVYPADAATILRRGVFWLADRVAPLAPAARWEGCRTVGDLMRALAREVVAGSEGTALGSLAGEVFDDAGAWIDAAVVEETAFLSSVRPVSEGIAERTAARATRTLASLPLGTRLPETAAKTVKERDKARAERDKARASAKKARAERDKAQAQLKRVNSSRAVRLVRRIRRLLPGR